MRRINATSFQCRDGPEDPPQPIKIAHDPIVRVDHAIPLGFELLCATRARPCKGQVACQKHARPVCRQLCSYLHRNIPRARQWRLQWWMMDLIFVLPNRNWAEQRESFLDNLSTFPFDAIQTLKHDLPLRMAASSTVHLQRNCGQMMLRCAW